MQYVEDKLQKVFPLRFAWYKGGWNTLRVVKRRLDRFASLHCWTADAAGQDAGALCAYLVISTEAQCATYRVSAFDR